MDELTDDGDKGGQGEVEADDLGVAAGVVADLAALFDTDPEKALYLAVTDYVATR